MCGEQKIEGTERYSGRVGMAQINELIQYRAIGTEEYELLSFCDEFIE
jgi:hypothetical protein